MLVHILILVEYVGYLLLLLAIQLFPKDYPTAEVSLFHFGLFEIRDELVHQIPIPQNRSGMISDKKAALLDLSTQICYALHTQDGLSCSVSHQADNSGMYQIYLGLQIGVT